MENPYQPPDSITWEPKRSDASAHGALDAESLEHIRQGQIFVNGAILLVALAMALVMLLLMHYRGVLGNDPHTRVWFGCSLVPAVCFGLAFALAGMARISQGLQDSIPLTLGLLPLLLVPLLNLLMLIAWSAKATVVLKANGFTMGFMGAKKALEPRFQMLSATIVDEN